MSVTIKKEISPRSRVKSTFQFEKTDRVPINYSANRIVHELLAKKLNVSADRGHVQKALGVDFRGLRLDYTGPKLFEDIPNRNVNTLWGIHTKLVKNEFGEYWDYCDFPMKNKTVEEIVKYPMPNPDHFDYEGALEWCKSNQEYAIIYGDPGLGDILNTTGMLFTVEEELMRIFENDITVRMFNDRRLRVQSQILERIMDKCSDYIELIWMGEDLGTQHSPLISLNTYRNFIKPRHLQIVDIATGYNKPTMIHSCGSSSWAFDDFIEIGIRGVDTLQPEAANMSPDFLVEHYGGKLVFHGCVSTAGSLAYGDCEDVHNNVKSVLDIMKPTKGYCMAPTHLIQDNTPVENIIQMYKTAHDYGAY